MRRTLFYTYPHSTVVGPDVPFRFTTPVHMQITGFGFFDDVHKGFVLKKTPNGNHGSSVKTFCELHSAWNDLIKH